MNDPQQVRDLLIQNGLADKADPLMALLRPSIRIFTQPAEDAVLPIGTSKIGGEPDLPPGFEWPTWEHEPPTWFIESSVRDNMPLPEKIRPLGFLAQFNLAEIAPYDVEHLLPSNGMLYFFYDGVEMPHRERVFDGGARVYYYDVTTLKRLSGYRTLPLPSFNMTDHNDGDVSRTALPRELPRKSRFKACRVTFTTELTLPSIFSSYSYIKKLSWEEGIFSDEVPLSEEEATGYENTRKTLIEDSKTKWRTTHRLLGHSQPIQYTPELECEEMSSVGHSKNRASENAQPWRLLLQLDTDDYAGMMWGDVGKLYFCVPKNMLPTQRFETGATIRQCY